MTNCNLKIMRQVLNVYFWSTTLYVSERWTVGVPEKKRLEAFEI